MSAPLGSSVPGRASWGIFVTGTDTDVGKTVVSAGLCLALARLGYRAGVVKGVQSGALAADPIGDAMRLSALTGVEETPEEIAPFSFAAPLAPAIAARLEGVRLELAHVVERLQAVAKRYEVTVVEGAGGLLAPIGEHWTNADLAIRLGLPVLVVARAGLGTVNHSALTVLRARELGLQVIGVVLNGVGDESSPWNAELIERIASVPVLGWLPWQPDACSKERLGELVATNLDVRAIAAALTVESLTSNNPTSNNVTSHNPTVEKECLRA